MIACPESCKCKSGGAEDGGKPVNSEGRCDYFCSPGGYCGDAQHYKTNGIDCTLCKQGKSLLVIWTINNVLIQNTLCFKLNM